MPGQILACGGVSLGSRFDDLVLERSGQRVCFVPTASTHPETRLVSFYESFAHRAEASHVTFNPWPRQDLREHILARDAIYVAGGSTANMLAVWRVHGFDMLLREAWERGALLCGWSAGMIFRHADVVVWLDQPMRVWLPRLVRRTFARVLRREQLWGTNRESIWNVFFSRDSLLLFTFRHYRRRRRLYPERLAPFNLVRLRTPAEVERFLRSARPPSAK